jgi:cytochrome c553
MNTRSIRVSALIAMLLGAGALHAAPKAIAQLDVYRQQGIEQADAARGKQLWYAESNQRSCANCHGEKPTSVGKHVKTGKPIEPMAPSLNPQRFQSAKKIEKWFLRNCKWTFGRECSAQEKADILTWLAGQ